MSDEHAVIARTRRWVDAVVIGLNLCPFAKAVQVKEQVQYVVSAAETPGQLLADLERELLALTEADPELVDTTLLIHPRTLANFQDYNDFLGVADAKLTELGLEGELQIASFHPRYRFAGSAASDPANYTNRSPFPMLHLLRESSVSRAVDAFPDTTAIYERNIQTLQALAPDELARLLSDVEG
jgi:hypothetical protein